MKQIAPKKYAVSLYEVLQDTSPSQHEALLISFVNLLARHKMLAKADKIIKYFDLYADEKAHVKKVKLGLTQPLDQALQKDIINNLEKILHCQIRIIEKLQPDLIGGVTIEYDDIRIDGSIKKQLAVMAEKLKC